jgi:hypothetical protein
MTEPTQNYGRPALARETAEGVQLSAGTTTTVPTAGFLNDRAPCGRPWYLAWPTFLAGRESGFVAGYAQGYADALDVIRPAAEELAKLRPSKAIEEQVARAYRKWVERPRWATPSPTDQRGAS